MNDADRRECLEQLHAASYRWSLVCCRGNPQAAAEILQSSCVKVLEDKRAFRGEVRFGLGYLLSFVAPHERTPAK